VVTGRKAWGPVLGPLYGQMGPPSCHCPADGERSPAHRTGRDPRSTARVGGIGARRAERMRTAWPAVLPDPSMPRRLPAGAGSGGTDLARREAAAQLVGIRPTPPQGYGTGPGVADVAGAGEAARVAAVRAAHAGAVAAVAPALVLAVAGLRALGMGEGAAGAGRAPQCPGRRPGGCDQGGPAVSHARAG